MNLPQDPVMLLCYVNTQLRTTTVRWMSCARRWRRIKRRLPQSCRGSIMSMMKRRMRLYKIFLRMKSDYEQIEQEEVFPPARLLYRI